MDMSNINIIANRRRFDTDFEKISEALSRERTNIIKIKVNQDVAYWDLKEKQEQVESNYEKLKQNMQELLMQHEAISGQYHEELRCRPETLNQIKHTQKICEVVVNYSEQIQKTMNCFKTDQESLYQRYLSAEQEIKKIEIEHKKIQECSKRKIEDLQRNAELRTEHMNSLHRIFKESKEVLESELAFNRNALNDARKTVDEMSASLNDASIQLNQCKFQLEKKDETISNLKKLLQDSNTKTSELQNTIADQENKYKQILETNQSLQTALSNQEALTKVVSDENLELKEKIKSLEEQNSTLCDTVKGLEKNSEDDSAIIDNLKRDNASLRTDMDNLKKSIEAKCLDDLAIIGNLKRDNTSLITEMDELKKNIEAKCLDDLAIIGNLKRDNTSLMTEMDELKKNIEAKCLLLSQAQKEIENLNSKILTIEMEKSEMNTQLNNNIKESDSKTVKIQELIGQVTDLEKNILKLENEYKVYRQTCEDRTKQMTAMIEHKDKELNSKTEIINELTLENNNNAVVRANLETNIQILEENIEKEKDNAKERENKLEAEVERLKVDAQEKDEEIQNLMQEVLANMSAKDRLQMKIDSLQNTIDNAQKELVGKEVPRHREQAEQDDNMSLSPVIWNTIKQPTLSTPSNIVKPTMTTALNDTSRDYEDSIDPTIVKLRFEQFQRDEFWPTMRTAELKRRRPRPPTPTRDLHFANNDLQNPLQSTQPKNDAEKDKKFFKRKRANKKK